jgi:hypothetical protein
VIGHAIQALYHGLASVEAIANFYGLSDFEVMKDTMWFSSMGLANMRFMKRDSMDDGSKLVSHPTTWRVVV